MATTGLFFGSNGGATEDVAQRIASHMGEVDIFSISKKNVDEIRKYKIVIFGTSTMGVGDLQDDWQAVFSQLDNVDLSDTTVALFGLGDQEGFSDTFLDGMGILHEKVAERGAHLVGRWNQNGYDFIESAAMVDGAFVGLALDEENQPDLTDERILKWVEQLKTEISKGEQP